MNRLETREKKKTVTYIKLKVLLRSGKVKENLIQKFEKFTDLPNQKKFEKVSWSADPNQSYL